MKKYLIDDEFVFDLVFYNKKYFNLNENYKIKKIEVKFDTYYKGYSIIGHMSYFANKNNMQKSFFIHREKIDYLYSNVIIGKRKRKLERINNKYIKNE